MSRDVVQVKNLRSQVARFALATFCDMFEHLKRNMDIELDITVKVIILKTGESNEFFRWVLPVELSRQSLVVAFYMIGLVLISAFKPWWRT